MNIRYSHAHSQAGATALLLFDGLLLPHVCACVVHLSWSVRRYVMDTLLYLITEETYAFYEEAVATAATTNKPKPGADSSASSTSGAEASLADEVPSPHMLLLRAWDKSALVLDEYTPYSSLVLIVTNRRGICNEEKLLQRDDYTAFLVRSFEQSSSR